MGTRILDFADGFSTDQTPNTAGNIAVDPVTQDIANAGEITLQGSSAEQIKVQGDGGATTASSTPFGSTAPSEGTLIYLVGVNDTNTVTLVFSDTAKGCVLNGDAVLARFCTLTLMYDATLDRYLEVDRNF